MNVSFNFFIQKQLSKSTQQLIYIINYLFAFLLVFIEQKLAYIINKY